MQRLRVDYPRDRDIHTLVDFMELLCITSPDQSVSVATMLDHIKDNKGNASFAPVSEDECADILTQVSWREAAYGEAYPFRLRNGIRAIDVVDRTSPLAKVYLFILVCANLPMIERKNHQTLTDAFETCCLEVMKSWWPPSAKAVLFGKNTTEYKGLKHEKISLLSRQIGGRGEVSANFFRGKDAGDAGIDLAAWRSLDDHEAENIPSALAQCACSRTDWVSKQSEIALDRLSKIISPSARWTEILFCPISFRDNLGKWAVPAEVATIVFVDRLRILHAVKAMADPAIIFIPGVASDLIEPVLDLV